MTNETQLPEGVKRMDQLKANDEIQFTEDTTKVVFDAYPSGGVMTRADFTDGTYLVLLSTDVVFTL